MYPKIWKRKIKYRVPDARKELFTRCIQTQVQHMQEVQHQNMVSTTYPWILRGDDYGHSNSVGDGLFGFTNIHGRSSSVYGVRTILT